MKKRIGLYVGVWTVLLALFNVIAFVSVGWIEQEKYTSSFWIGYVLISVAFVAQLACALFAFHADNEKKLFYNISLIKTGYAGLIASFVFGGLCMLISPLPYWVGVLLCAIVLVCNILSVVKAGAAIGEVVRVENNVETQTFFLKIITADAEALMQSSKTDALGTEAKRVYEAIRYSDPMSNSALTELEKQIEQQFLAFSDAVKAEDAELAKATADALLEALARRNGKCKLLK